MADEALKLGAIDQVGYLEDAWNYAATVAKLTKPQVVRFDPPTSSANTLLGGGDQGALTVPVPSAGGGVHVYSPAVERALDEVLDPRPMAVYRRPWWTPRRTSAWR